MEILQHIDRERMKFISETGCPPKFVRLSFNELRMVMFQMVQMGHCTEMCDRVNNALISGDEKEIRKLAKETKIFGLTIQVIDRVG